MRLNARLTTITALAAQIATRTAQRSVRLNFQLGLFAPGAPVHDEATALRAMVAKGAMPPLVLVVSDCRKTCEEWRARGVEFTQEPMERYGSIDAGFRDPSGNGWKMVQSRVMVQSQLAGQARPKGVKALRSTGCPLLCAQTT
jgi:hypothetical protein